MSTVCMANACHKSWCGDTGMQPRYVSISCERLCLQATEFHQCLLLLCPTACRAPLVAFKAVAAGNASQPTGAYVFYQDPYGTSLGSQVAIPGANTFTNLQQCLDACDAVTNCAGVSMAMLVVEALRPTSCTYIYGSDNAAQEARSFVRADATRLSVPELI